MQQQPQRRTSQWVDDDDEDDTIQSYKKKTVSSRPTAGRDRERPTAMGVDEPMHTRSAASLPLRDCDQMVCCGDGDGGDDDTVAMDGL